MQIVGTPFQSYQQYCAWMDEVLASFRAPLMNGLPLACDARGLIEKKRLSFVKRPDHALVFSAYEGYLKLYFASEESATLVLPPVRLPVITDQIRLEGKAYPAYDALMERSRFALAREKASMDRVLDEPIRPERYFRAEPMAGVSVSFAIPGEYYKIIKLLRKSFDSLLDELPAKDTLLQGIRDGNVFVIRDRERIAATMVRVVRGHLATLYWVAVDVPYRRMKLSGLLHYVGDLDSRKRGYRRVMFWVDVKAKGWIAALEKRGYRLTGQRLLTYAHHPPQKNIL